MSPRFPRSSRTRRPGAEPAYGKDVEAPGSTMSPAPTALAPAANASATNGVVDHPATITAPTGFGSVDAVLEAALDKAVAVPSKAIHAHVDRLRRRHPEASPAQIVTLLEKQYLLAVSTSGGAVGAAAAAPAVGTGVALALTSSEVATFFAASSAFALAVADVHGIAVEDTARRRTLLLATVLGEQGTATVGAETGLNVAWARTLLVNMPTATIKRVNNVLTRRILRRQAARQGALAFGRLAPFGIGAVIGATGARALGRTVVTGARRAFGPPPDHFPRVIELPSTPIEPPNAPVDALPGRTGLPEGPGTPEQPAPPEGPGTSEQSAPHEAPPLPERPAPPTEP